MPHYRRTIALRDDYPDAHNKLDSALASRGMLKAAAGKFRKAPELSPDHAEARTSLGGIPAQLGRQRIAACGSPR